MDYVVSVFVDPQPDHAGYCKIRASLHLLAGCQRARSRSLAQLATDASDVRAKILSVIPSAHPQKTQIRGDGNSHLP